LNLSFEFESSLIRSNRARIGLASFILVWITLAVYLPVIWFDFTNYDDPSYVTDNIPVLNGLTWAGVKWAFTHSHSGNWHPLTWISHMIDCQIYGLNPGGHHVTNVVIHICNTLLLFGVLRFMTGALWRSALVAAVFAIHPLHVESVAWISERKDVLSGFFGLLSIWAYAAYVKTGELPTAQQSSDPPWRWNENPHVRRIVLYSASLILLACGLMSKAMLVTWPFVFLLLDYWPLGRFQKAGGGQRSRKELLNLLFEKAPFFALSAAICYVTIHTQRSAAALAPLADVPIGSRVMSATASVFLYIQKLAWPARLSAIYLDVGQHAHLKVLLGGTLLLVTTLIGLRFYQNRPYLLIGLLWFLGTLTPVIGLVKVGSQSMADRYTYLPAIGIFVMVVWAASNLANHWKARVITVAGAIAGLVALTSVAQAQVMFWQNTETLFRHALAVTGKNFIAFNSLGFYFSDFGEFNEAKRMFKDSLAENPASAAAWNKLGSVLMNQGHYEEAVEDCKKALQINPRMAEALGTLGLIYIKEGKTNEALLSYSKAIEFRPDYAPAHYNIANVLAHQGQLDLAADHYQASLATDPRSGDAHNNLAFILARKQKFDEAIGHFRIALQLKQNFWQAHYGLGELLLRQNQFKPAAAEFWEVLRLKPDFAVAQFQMAVALAREGNVNEALSAAAKAQALAEQTGQQELARKSQELMNQLRPERAQ
jgi:tetratricopeptide (TPR) repeat protein